MARRNHSYNWRYTGIFLLESSAIGGRKLAETRFIDKSLNQSGYIVSAESGYVYKPRYELVSLRAEDPEALVNPLKRLSTYVLVGRLAGIVQPLRGLEEQGSEASKNSLQHTERDGQHDFDFEIATGETHLRRLVHPRTASTTWIEYEGTTVVRKVWKGRANLVELEADGPRGHFESLNLRLYNPESHPWSFNFAGSSSGALSQPTIGEFKKGRGEFFDQETLNGRAIFVRFVRSDITPDSCRFEQAFSEDGGNLGSQLDRDRSAGERQV
jgi:hypothetical protein